MGIQKPIDGDQARAITAAGQWRTEQSERLGVTVAELEAAVLRGWPGNEIAALPASRAAELNNPPTCDPEHEAALQKIKAAPVKPLHLDPRERPRRR